MNKWVIISVLMLVFLTIGGLVLALVLDWMSLGTFLGVTLLLIVITGLAIMLVYFSKKLQGKTELAESKKLNEKTQKELLLMVKDRMLHERHELIVMDRNVQYYHKGEIMRVDGVGTISKNKWSILVPVKNPDKMVTLKDARESEVVEAANGMVNPIVLKDMRTHEFETPFGTQRTQEEITRLPPEKEEEDNDLLID